MSTDDSSVRARDMTSRGGDFTLIAAAVGFLLFYLLVDPVTSGLASSAIPLPDDPVETTRVWFADNRSAAVMTGVVQFLSVCCLAIFAVALGRAARTPAQLAVARRARPWGLTAAALMVLSSVLGWTLAAVAPGASSGTVSVLRTANFVAGGTAHVLVMGIFVLLVSRISGFGRPMRVFAYVALVPSVLSPLALVWFYAGLFILLGRLLCMVWIISAAVNVTRKRSKGTWGSRTGSLSPLSQA